jgi:methionyl aminopeptidase
MVAIKTDKEIEQMATGGKILADIIKIISDKAKPGATTGQLEDLACSLIKEVRARPSFKGYKAKEESIAFPTALCLSINNEIVHTPALPSRRLNDGDIVGIDLGIEYPAYAKATAGKPYSYSADKIRSFYADMAVTVPIGKVSREARKLIKVTRKSLGLAIKQVKPNNTLNDIAEVIQTYVEKHGFRIVRDLVGHGVGYSVHEDPQIPNYVVEGKKFDNVILKPGMVLAIEPMVCAGSYEIKNAPDGFSIVTADGSLSAHFEHTVAVTKDGCRVLTKI